MRETNALAKRLGPGWKPRVNENLGWHGCVEFAGGIVDVWRPNGSDKYHCIINGPVSVAVYATTPEEAVRVAVREVRKSFDRMTAEMDAISKLEK